MINFSDSSHDSSFHDLSTQGIKMVTDLADSEEFGFRLGKGRGGRVGEPAFSVSVSVSFSQTPYIVVWHSVSVETAGGGSVDTQCSLRLRLDWVLI